MLWIPFRTLTLLVYAVSKTSSNYLPKFSCVGHNPTLPLTGIKVCVYLWACRAAAPTERPLLTALTDTFHVYIQPHRNCQRSVNAGCTFWHPFTNVQGRVCLGFRWSPQIMTLYAMSVKVPSDASPTNHPTLHKYQMPQTQTWQTCIMHCPLCCIQQWVVSVINC